MTLSSGANPDSANRAKFRLVVGLTSLFFLVFLSIIWIPELRHYYVCHETVTSAMIERGRTVPSNEELEELRSHRLLEHNWQSTSQLVAKADELLKGTVQIPGQPEIKIHLPFDPSDLDQGPSSWQLQFSGFIVPEILIDAYRATGREEFYVMAREVVLAWSKYESHAWLNRGFLWNDHAVAARARTLADFWSIYRHRSDYRQDVAQQIWTFAARTGALLAKPDQFTFATNHGVMQNIGLLQICLAFPSLPRTEEYKEIAMSRLKDQISFFVSPSGVVLEHSADYHEFGFFLFGVILRYTTLLHLEAPPEWYPKYENAKRFYAEIRRPDGSLAPFGDATIGALHNIVPQTERDEKGGFKALAVPAPDFHPDPLAIYPTAGYAVLWDGIKDSNSRSDLSQTVVAWSNYPGHGHKHSDEPSVLLWSKGQEWWTNAGYWPYDDADRSHAECWEGSNAPHLADEKCISDRSSNLVSSLESSTLFAAEIERKGPGGLRVKRLVVHEPPSIWVVADESTGGGGKILNTIWTTAPNVKTENGPTANMYMLTSESINEQLQSYFLGPSTLRIDRFRGSRDPFAGWISSGWTPTPTDAFVSNQPAEGAWAITVWVLGQESSAGSNVSQVAIAEWRNPSSWKVEIPLKGKTRLISRDGDTISVKEDIHFRHEAITGKLKPAPSANLEIAALRANFEEAEAHYPRFRDLAIYRLRASIFGIAMLLLQEVTLAIYGRFKGSRLIVVRSLCLIAWAGLCVWVQFYYLNVT